MYNNTTISCWSLDQPITQCSWMGGWLLITIVGGNQSRDHSWILSLQEWRLAEGRTRPMNCYRARCKVMLCLCSVRNTWVYCSSTCILTELYIQSRHSCLCCSVEHIENLVRGWKWLFPLALFLSAWRVLRWKYNHWQYIYIFTYYINSKPTIRNIVVFLTIYICTINLLLLFDNTMRMTHLKLI